MGNQTFDIPVNSFVAVSTSFINKQIDSMHAQFGDTLEEINKLNVQTMDPMCDYTSGLHERYEDLTDSITNSNQYLAIWNSIKTFGDLIHVMQRFLEGKIPGHPWHRAPLTPDYVPQANTLIAITNNGFVTTNGQPGTCTYDRPTFEGGLENEIQRGYTEGFMYKPYVETFVQRAMKHGGMIVVVGNKPHFPPLDTSSFAAFRNSVVLMYKKTKDLVTGVDHIALTANGQQVVGSGWEHKAGTTFYLEDDEDRMESKLGIVDTNLRNLLSACTEYVTVIMIESRNEGLNDAILELLSQVRADMSSGCFCSHSQCTHAPKF